MRLKASILIPLSIVFGLGAVQTGRSWLDRQMSERAALLEAQNKIIPPQYATIVVAARPLRFGNEIRPGMLKELPWPSDNLPAGAFSKVSDIFEKNHRRVALAAVENNEPLLATKMTGPGQKANLAAMITTGMKALTVRVDDVVGVAGFVLPGDRVDVLLTRSVTDHGAFSDNILQNIKVLAIDQKADDRLDKPAVARAVTVEVTTDQAQKLIVAQKVGTLTLVLRPVGETKVEPGRRVSSSQLQSGLMPRRQVSNNTKPDVVAAPRRSIAATVNVYRRANKQEYSVPRGGR